MIKWRRVYELPPPALPLDDVRHPRFDPMYKDLNRNELPSAESLQMTRQRVTPLWTDVIKPQVHHGKQVVIVAHMNTLRALLMQIQQLRPDEVNTKNLPTATPYVLEFDRDMNCLRSYFDVDAKELERR